MELLSSSYASTRSGLSTASTQQFPRFGRNSSDVKTKPYPGDSQDGEYSVNSLWIVCE